MNNNILGYTSYNGHMLQQHDNYELPFSLLLENKKPNRILEIGTGDGGLTLFLRNKLNELGLSNSIIRSYDINSTMFDLPNLQTLKDNLFSYEYNLIRQDLISPFIKSEGITIVLCDGGNKIKEFNQIAKLLKDGDIIMAHDYVYDYDLFTNHYLDKIWNWCEIQEKDIIDVCLEENLIDFMKEEFNSIVWTCKLKKEK
jgi:predicted O-methyltransferase YrrM